MIKSSKLQIPNTGETPNSKLHSTPANNTIKRVNEVTLTQSGIGLPHSRTLSRFLARQSIREVLECGSPMPLSTEIAQPDGNIRSLTAANVPFTLGFGICCFEFLWSLVFGIRSF
jgi:hypothetical protein